MDKIINFGIPHVGEQIFESLNEKDLVRYLEVSKTWKVLAETILFKKWKGKLKKACELGKTSIVRILLDNLNGNHDELNEHDSHVLGKSAFTLACEKGRTNVVKLLLDHPNCKDLDINIKCKYGFTGFMRACDMGRKDIVKFLLDHPRNKEIDFNIVTTFCGSTALLLASHCADKGQLVKLLLDYTSSERIDINAKDDKSYTTFMYACGFGDTDLIKLLLNHPRSSKEIDVGRTAFMLACNSKNDEAVKLILDHENVSFEEKWRRLQVSDDS